MSLKFNKSNELSKILPILTLQNINEEKSIVISHTQLLFVLKCLKLHFSYQYNLLTAISGVDFLGKEYRFSVIYDLLSLTFNSRLRLKVFINEITGNGLLFEVNLDFFCFLIQLDLLFFRDVRIW